MKVLVTGGAGYIGSTICSALKDKNYIPVVLDSLINGRSEFAEKHIFYKGDISDEALLELIFNEHPDIEFTIHCAALIVVPDSVTRPNEYYLENVVKSLILFRKLKELGCNKIVFSSSASMYDDVENFMVTEKAPLKPRSPYARTKYMMEMILQDFCNAYKIKGISLRYFNPIGADPMMRTGMYQSNPTHVLGKLVSVASGEENYFQITGVNWPTRDGSGIRDYVHVWDLVQAHIKAVENFEYAFNETNNNSGYLVINLGTGNGTTVKELVQAFEKVINKEIKKVETEPRFGDVAGSYANADLANKLLGWKSELTLEQGIADALKWQDIRTKVLNS